MAIQRKATTDAIMALLAPLTGSGFVTVSRAIVPVESCPAANQPALYLERIDGHAHGVTRQPTKWTLHYHLAVYVSGATCANATGAADVGDALDLLLDAVELALAPGGADEQTLGGLVTHCRIAGDVLIAEGRLTTPAQAVALVPLEVVLSS